MGANEFDFIIVGKESGRGDLGVVEDEQVVGLEVGWEIGEHPVLDFSGVSMDDHHARGGAVVERSASDEFVRQVVIEIGGLEHEVVLNSKF